MTSTPKGYLKKHNGTLIPVDQVKEIDQLRDEIVCQISRDFLAHQKILQDFKRQVLSDINAFVALSAEQYNTKLGGEKGNLSLLSFDGAFKISVQVSEYIVFDERLQVAKQLIDECIHAWSNGADDKILTLVNDAFQVDKAGNVSTSRILGLRRLDIKDKQWQQAMLAIADSMTISGSKTYVRAYQRLGQTDQWQSISLDFASLDVGP